MNVVNDDKNAHHDLTNQKRYDEIIKTIIAITEIHLGKDINQPPYISCEHPTFFFYFIIPRKFTKEKSFVRLSPPHLKLRSDSFVNKLETNGYK